MQCQSCLFLYISTAGSAVAVAVTVASTPIQIRNIVRVLIFKLKSFHQYIHQAPHTYHYKQRNDAINHKILSLFSLFFIVATGNILKYADNKHQHGDGDKKNNHGTDNTCRFFQKTAKHIISIITQNRHDPL